MTGVAFARRALAALDGVERRLGRDHPPPMLPTMPGTIVVWTMDRIGDVLRATPVFRLLRDRYPSAEITAVVAARAAPIVAGNPAIDRLVAVEPYRPGSHFNALRSLRGRRFDLGLMLEVDPAWCRIGAWWFRKLAVPAWIGLDLGQARPRGARLVPLDHRASWQDHFIRAAQAAGTGLGTAAPEILLGDAERRAAVAKLAARGVEHDRPFFLIHPGGGAQVVSRQWSADRYGQVAAALAAQWGWPVVVTGSPPERAAVDRVKAIAGRPLVDLCGELTLRELAAVIERAALVVTNDTGPLHIAQALRRPAVAVLGPTAPEVVDLRETTRAVYADLPCRPCAFLTGWTACSNPRPMACLSEVSVDAVVAAVADRLVAVSVHGPAPSPVGRP